MQRYLIFNGEAKVVITEKKNDKFYDQKTKIIDIDKKSELGELLPYILKTTKAGTTCFRFKDPKKIYLEFRSYFKYQPTAGGIVRNKEGKILFIYNDKQWDLPKGKLHDDERFRDCALREVKEECHVHKLRIIRKTGNSYHISSSKKVLKKTHWYEMKCKDDNKILPHYDEGITDVQWFDRNWIFENLLHIKPYIREILLVYLNMKS